MAEIDDEIAGLYQLPLSEFTPARNALAKRAGPRAAEVKALTKPSVAAWAVNQLYWQRRKTYDDLLKAAEALRTAHKKVLAGKTADLREADTAHRAALNAAADAARALLQAAGEATTQATLTQISETLDALPGGEPPGQLTKPLKRMGFEALDGAVIATGPRKADPIPLKKTLREREEPKKPPTKAEARAAEAAQRELERTRERLRFATVAEREAEAALDRARRDVERAERAHARLEQELEEAAATLDQLRKDEQRRRDAKEKATAERERLEKKLT